METDGINEFMRALFLPKAGEEDELLFCILWHYVIGFSQAFAGLIVHLAGRIEMSDLFSDMVKRSEVAAGVFAAAIEEFGEPSLSGNPTHRRLAQEFMHGVMLSLGLSKDAIPEFSREQVEIMRKIRYLYCSNLIEVTKEDLLIAVGANWRSERVAREEFSILHTLFAGKWSHMGDMLRQSNALVCPVSRTPFAWIDVHKNVEIGHADSSETAAMLAIEYSDDRKQASKLVFKGATEFAHLHKWFMATLLTE